VGRNYFQFKQFRIEQDQCANKVSTDACVFGAWLNTFITRGTLIDVGSGSGLLSLMLGHKPNLTITGIEIDQTCQKQALCNLQNSKWKSKIEFIHADMRKWYSEKKFDFIIGNPPFFKHSEKDLHTSRNIARQTTSLNPKDMATFATKFSHDKSIGIFLLSNNDIFVAYQKEFKLAGFVFQEKIELKDTAKSESKRMILLVSQKPIPFILDRILIYKLPDKSLSPAFKKLLSPYYLDN